MYYMHLMICAGTGCVSNKSFDVRDALKRELARHQLQDDVQIVATGCHGFCAQGPIVLVQPEHIFYQLLTVEQVSELVEEHCLKGRPVEKFMYRPAKKAEVIPYINEIEFFKKQQPVALANRGIIDPENIDEYIAWRIRIPMTGWHSVVFDPMTKIHGALPSSSMLLVMAPLPNARASPATVDA